MAEDWVKCHSTLTKGKWRGVPKAWRFLVLEMAIEARPQGGHFDLPWGTRDPIEALARMFDDDDPKQRRDNRRALQFLTTNGTDQDPPTIQIEADRDPKRIKIPRFAFWNRAATDAERARTYRERERAREELPQGRTQTPVTAPSRPSRSRGEERRSEKKRSPLSPPEGATTANQDHDRESEPTPAPKAKPAKSRGHRLPDDWQPSQQLIDYAATKLDYDRLETLEIAEAFRDHWHASSQRNALKLDWDAAFRTWLRNERKRHPAVENDDDDVPFPLPRTPRPPNWRPGAAARAHYIRVAKGEIPPTPYREPPTGTEASH